MPTIKRYKGYWIVCNKSKDRKSFLAMAERSLLGLLLSPKCLSPSTRAMYFAFRESMDEAIAVCKQDIDKEFWE